MYWNILSYVLLKLIIDTQYTRFTLTSLIIINLTNYLLFY